MMKRILVGTDLSEAADEALRQAHTRATATGAKLGVVHVIPSLVGAHPLFPQENAAWMAQVGQLEAKALAAVEGRVKTLVGSTDVELFLERGAEHVEILRRAESWAADLVVVGSHGRTGLPRLLLGSIAEQVVRYAHCPVLVARAGAKRGVVLAATDLSDPSLPAVKTGAEEAKLRGARLIVAHALDFITPALTATLAAPFVAAPPVLTVDARQQIREGLHEMLKDAVTRAGAAAELQILEGPAATAIVRCADELGADLVVVGTHGRTGLARLALGSTAEKVIRGAACSVMAVRLRR
jgi:nucleotide-binding universal stress UspA family protein